MRWICQLVTLVAGCALLSSPVAAWLRDPSFPRFVFDDAAVQTIRVFPTPSSAGGLPAAVLASTLEERHERLGRHFSARAAFYSAVVRLYARLTLDARVRGSDESPERVHHRSA